MICLYVLDEESARTARAPLGGAARWWLAQSLRALQSRASHAIGAALVLRKGPAARIIADIGARDRGQRGVLERDRAGAASGGRRSGRRGA